jgi:hypothetical protein
LSPSGNHRGLRIVGNFGLYGFIVPFVRRGIIWFGKFPQFAVATGFASSYS